METCPYCKQQLSIIPFNSPVSTFFNRHTTFENASPTPFSMPITAQPTDYQKVTPIARLEPRDVTTALYDSGVSFVLVALAGGAIAYAAGLPWLVSPAGGLTIAMWRYFGGLNLARSLLEIVETITHKDIDKDGVVGKPTVVKVEVKNKGTWQFATLPGKPENLVALAQAITTGESFAERTATDKGLTQEEYSNLRDMFVDRGWAAWNHKTRRQAGVTLTVSGKSVLRSIAAAPLPQDDAGVEL
jgi:hypothetical protein